MFLESLRIFEGGVMLIIIIIIIRHLYSASSSTFVSGQMRIESLPLSSCLSLIKFCT